MSTAHAPLPSVGIHGMSTAFPSIKRLNSDWPQSFRDKLEERMKRDVTTLTGVDALLMKHQKAFDHDPFRGAVERYVLEPGRPSSSLEAEAGREALARAEAAAGEIDVLIMQSLVPDVLGIGNGTAVHHALGLRSDVLVLNLENTCNTFVSGLETAAALIQSRRARKVLVVMSNCMSRVMDMMAPSSVNLGDAASAMVIGEVSEGLGLLGSAFGADGSVSQALHIAPLEGEAPWYDPRSRLVVRTGDVGHARALLGRLGPLAAESTRRACHAAKLDSVGSLDFFTCTQATAWMPALVLEAVGHPFTFPEVGHIGASNLAYNLERGLREGKVRHGSLAGLLTTGAGAIWGCVVLRWGR